MEEANNTRELLELLRAGQPEDKLNVDTSTVRYGLYARKSTPNEDRQVRSVPDQISECMEKVVAPNDLNVVRIYQGDSSAKESGTRAVFTQMLKDIQDGKIDGIIAWHPDRLSRNMKEAGEIIDLIDKNRIRDLRFATFNFENNPAGKMLLGITFVVSKQYSEHLSESVDRGNRKSVEDGEFIGKFKHGYYIDAERHFQPDENNFLKVQRMFRMALAGESQKSIRLWINKQNYTVVKREGQPAVPHVWDKDDVSKLLRDPHYAGVHKWGKNFVDLIESYDFTPMITVAEYLKINKIDSLKSSKVLTLTRPKSGDIRANLLRGMVYCAHCSLPLTSMIIDKKDKADKTKIVESRYYYKCETVGCAMYGKSARAKYVLDAAKEFFSTYLFVREDNYAEYVKMAEDTIKKKNKQFDSMAAQLRVTIANKDKAYEQTKELLLQNPDLQAHYDLDKRLKEIKSLRQEFEKITEQRTNTKTAIITYEKYLKLFDSIPVILRKVHDMKTMDTLLRSFFLNFEIKGTEDGFKQGSKVSYKLKEPWAGFLLDEKFAFGAGKGTLTLGLVLGKDAL